jgi:hypothetical protein
VNRAAALVGVLGLAAFLTTALSASGRSRAAEPELTGAQSDYLEQCGGCHGLQGDSAPAPIPVLRDRVGYFMCSEAGRRYLLRLPNIAHSRIEDNQRLAEMMNFVVFDLGGVSAPRNARPFTEAEVAAERGQAMVGFEVFDTRKAVVADLVRSCRAPASLRQAYPGEPAHKAN